MEERDSRISRSECQAGLPISLKTWDL